MEHIVSAAPHPFIDGAWVACCSCGWEASGTFDRRILAVGAGDRHKAAMWDRAAWQA